MDTMDSRYLAELVCCRFENLNPNPKIELEYTNEYTLLVAIVLSAQATDKGVNKATRHLFAVADTPGKMIALGIGELKKYIKTIGLFNNKARHIMALSQQLVDSAGHVPHIFHDLIRLPGVGRKTAKVFLNTVLGAKCMPVDCHVERVSQRIGLSKARNALGVERDLEEIVPDRFLDRAHHWLVLHGRYTCRARKPLCAECCIRDLCAYVGIMGREI